jgi:hypothetical protein
MVPGDTTPFPAIPPIGVMAGASHEVTMTIKGPGTIVRQPLTAVMPAHYTV